MKRMTRLLFLTLFSVLLLACAGAPDLSQPPDIVYGEDICVECNMIISEPRFAAAYYTVDGEARRFDDIGDMCSYHGRHQEEVVTFWVHDYDTEAWLPAEEAAFVLSSEVYTPMAFGVVAFTEKNRAEAFAAEVDGVVLTFDHLLEHYGIGHDEMDVHHEDHQEEGEHMDHEHEDHQQE